MSTNVILVFCAQALFIQLTFSQCAGRANSGAGVASYGWSTPIAPGCASGDPALPAPTFSAPGPSYRNAGLSDLGSGSGLAIDVIPTRGGSLPVSSFSSIAPTGITIVSENIFDGTLYVVGELPFVSAVTLDGVLTSSGAGAVSHSCGNGVTAAVSIAPSTVVTAPGTRIGADVTGLGAYGLLAGSPLSIAPGVGCTAAESIAPYADVIAPGTEIRAYGSKLGAHGLLAGSPLSIAPEVGCNAVPAPVVVIVAPIDGCYPGGIYY